MAVKRGWLRRKPLRRDRRLRLKGPAAVLAPSACPIDTRGHEPSPQIAFRFEEDILFVRVQPFHQSRGRFSTRTSTV